ncbi:MAG: SDR family oxidoreductase [Alphaproteobacteria bacterium]|nr:SDR family oxidoreductase [Alphaproteobacteria bacterium]QQS57416.1 MAG: SDR family oxidoreductase [Alphaproteobacteria bacterium]
MSADPHTLSQKHLFCFGHGYCCDYLGHELIEKEGWKISGTTRDPDKKNILRERGIRPFTFDETHPLADPLYILRDVTHILISTPPAEEGDPTFVMHAADICQLPGIEWIGYLSTTGAYGDRGGGWVDETSEVRPTTIRGTRRARAEEQWLSLHKSHKLPVHVFRLAGIYGPGRSALDSVRAGVARRIDKPGHAFSRIHVEDIVQVLRASIARPAPGQIYNLCDDEPVPSHVVIDYACKLLKLPSPPLIPFDKVDLAPITRSFYADNKRVSNEKIKKALGVELKYKSYREGLEACLAAEKSAISTLRDYTQPI